MAVEIDAKWWGYNVMLNKAAVNKLDLCLDVLDNELKSIFKNPELREAVAIAIKIKQKRLKNVTDRTGNQGCNLISPWIMPFALTVVRNTGGGDQNLWYTVWEAEKGEWGEQAEFNDNLSRSGPALAQHGDKLYCVHRGQDNDENLNWTVYTTNDDWSDDYPMTGKLTTTTPCLVEFDGDLYCFHHGHKEFTDHTTADTPALVVYDNKLLIVHRGYPDENLYYAQYNGTNWINGDKDELKIPNESGTGTATSNHGVGLAVFDNKVFMMHRSSLSDGQLWYNIYTSSSGWSGDRSIESQFTGETPALACYKDPQVKAENYDDNETDPGMIVPRLICVHRGWGK